MNIFARPSPYRFATGGSFTPPPPPPDPVAELHGSDSTAGITGSDAGVEFEGSDT